MRVLARLLLALASIGCSTVSMQGGSPPPDANDVAVPPAPRLDSGKPPGDSGDGGFVCDPPAAPGSFYALSARNLANTRDVSMCEFRGKVILVVNTASYCGYTPQYKGLEDDYEKYQAQGFVILGFPCNQFGMQEPGDASDISNFCTSMYGVTFPMFQKIDVNGPNAHPIYVWLKAQPGGAGDITWNFNKFLLGRDGKLIKRYDSAVDPANPTLIADIEAALAK